MPVPREGLQLRVQGANSAALLEVRGVDLEAGKLGIITLSQPVAALSPSLVGSLVALVPTSAEDVEEHPEEFASPAPSLTLGEGDCAKFFRSNSGVIDRFRYSVLIRLVEPRLSAKQLVLQLSEGGEVVSFPGAGCQGAVSVGEGDRARRGFAEVPEEGVREPDE